MRVRGHLAVVACAALALLAPAAACARAETFTWTDGIGGGGLEPAGNGMWSGAGNWSGDQAPAGGPVNLVFPVSSCRSPFRGCPPADDDIEGLEAGTVTIGQRFARVPVVPPAPGELIPPPPPPHEPPPATYSLGGDASLKLRDGIGFETFVEGEGGGVEGPSYAALGMPLRLTGANTWTLGGEFGAELAVTAPVTGEEPLALAFARYSGLELQAPVEVGPVTIEGSGYMAFGQPQGGGDINGQDQEPVYVHGVSLFGSGTTGPLDVEGGFFFVGFPGYTGAVSVVGALVLGANTNIEFDENTANGRKPAAIVAVRAALGGARLHLAEGCPAPGASFVLVRAAGGITGTFSDEAGHPIVSGEVLEHLAGDCGPGKPAVPLQITYTPETVAATALASGVASQPAGEAPPAGPGGSPPQPGTGVADFATSIAPLLRTDLGAASSAHALRRLLGRGRATIALDVPVGDTLALTWTAASARHPRRHVLLARAALGVGGGPTRRVLVGLRRGARAASATLAPLAVTVRATLAAPGHAPVALSRSVRVG